MIQAKPKRKLSGVIALRLTPEEEKRVAEAAGGQGISVSAWLRRMALDAIACPATMRLLLAEVLALRAITLALHASSNPGSEPLIRTAINHADTRKSADAEARLLSIRNGEKL